MSTYPVPIAMPSMMKGEMIAESRKRAKTEVES